ncbi:MAG: hypothetical protein ACRD0D_15735, partial [Acidimicrobiales bacterium]
MFEEYSDSVDNVLSESRTWDGDGLGRDDIRARCTGSWVQLAARVSGSCSHGPNWHLVDQRDNERDNERSWKYMGLMHPVMLECQW